MTTKSVKRIAVSAVMGGVATLALAAPASAVREAPPAGGRAGGTAPTSTAQQAPAALRQSQDTGASWQALPVATGALGGIALAGAGVAVAGVRRRRGHQAGPA